MPFANPDQAFVHPAAVGRTEPEVTNAAVVPNGRFGVAPKGSLTYPQAALNE